MKQNITYVLSLVLVAGLMVGCVDLEVENRNSPDRAQALSDPGDVQNLIADTFQDYWRTTQWCGMSMMLSTMADAHSCSWANWGMRDMSSEPRIAWNNDPSYSRRTSVSNPWFRAYVTISNTNDGLNAISAAEAEGSVDENVFTRQGIDTQKLKAFAKFNQGLSHGLLALMFDQAFIVTEDVDLENDALELRPYAEVAEAAINMLDEAIALANANSFVITEDEDWIFGNEVSNTRLAQIASSYKARIRAQVARTEAERAAVNWSAVISDIQNGITESFIPIGDDDGDQEWDCMKFYGTDGGTWARADYRTIGPADEAGGYQNWLNTPTEDREVFDIVTADRRIQGQGGVDADGSYFQYFGVAGPFPAARGTYHYSSHTPVRWKPYRDANANGPMPVMLMAEMDMLHAEALLQTGGSTATVAELINKTRVANGELNPATAGDAVGSQSDDQSHLDSASLWAKLKHEKRIETLLTAAGLDFFDDRGWGDLVSNTPFHFPVPGAELETLGLQQYTFGGGGAGSAPKAGDGTPENAYWERNSRTF
ncbi:MAG: hypothetical protein AAGJ10_04860 [Bacteroidota bacterium]